MRIDRIVNLQISHLHSLNRVLQVSSTQDMLDMGFSATEPMFLAVQTALAQSPSLSVVYVGRVDVATATVTVANALSNKKYTVSLTWKDAKGVLTQKTYDFTAGTSPTKDSIITGLAAAITGDATAPVTATAATTNLTLVLKKGFDAFTMNAGLNLGFSYSNDVIDWNSALTLIQSENNDWYGMTINASTATALVAAANFATLNNKLFVGATDDPKCYDPTDSTDVLSTMQATGFTRAAGFYHGAASTEFAPAALMSAIFTVDPGNDQWGNQPLTGITGDVMTDTQAAAVFAKNGNTVEQMRNTVITQNGKVAAGEWIDVIRFRDWLAEEIKVAVADVMVNRPDNTKLPFTDGGIAIIENALRSVLQTAQDNGGIAPNEYQGQKQFPGYKVTVPKAFNISAEDKKARILKDIQFTARLSGAIIATEIRGTLTYDYNA